MKEKEWQRKIVQTIKDEGGWGRKWASPYAIGVPDLILCHGLFSTYFMEVKHLDVTNRSTKPVLVGLTDNQVSTCRQIEKAGGKVVVGAVVTCKAQKFKGLFLRWHEETHVITMDKPEYVFGSLDRLSDAILAYTQQEHLK